ncbi:MAG: hypothetical protein J7M03_04505 [Candidatus Desulfofervidaceae bacterium]|nr:hypothetical protein [Candidatus Desulfofervidaceae bacterium]MDL1969729.1 hypothetical protein [Candidatus Desulfofervidaceae bacterium]
MPQVTLNISLEELAKIINSMSKEDRETLSLMLKGEDKELLERKQDIELGKVTTLSRDEVFDV